MNEQRHEDHPARWLWRALEPIHAVTYFAPEPKAACDALGTRGYWMSYFGMRAAPLGEVGPEVVTALFYGFHPGLVARALPAAWAVAPASTFLTVRLESADAALRRLVGESVLVSPAVAEAAELARTAALAAPTAGRALGAANRALDWPEPAHLVLWHAQTILREQRGDGHVAALLTAGLDPAESLVLFAADADIDPGWLRERRGWSEPEWQEAAGRLRERGLLDDADHPTPAGVALRREVEEQTDEAASAPVAALGPERTERLVELAGPLVAAILGGGGFVTGNPMGLRPLVEAAAQP
jgi:hypothetical protein